MFLQSFLRKKKYLLMDKTDNYLTSDIYLI